MTEYVGRCMITEPILDVSKVRMCSRGLILPAKAREYVSPALVCVSVCVCLSVCDHDN